MQQSFDPEYKKLNIAQKDAVDTIDGPVMVIAGPGTGKTQVLALRIANILTKTDTTASGVLCLTFTRSGVRAMRERLFGYIGATAHDVRVSTFHSFATELVEKHFEILELFESAPRLLDDKDVVFLVDEILHTHEWEYLRPRGNPAMYFNDLKSLISLLKRERMTPEEFLSEIKSDITHIKNNPDNISSRGESKGKLKKEYEKKIEMLKRTREVVTFYELYEKAKITQCLMDYDDVLEYAVQLVESSDDIRNELCEQFLYVLVDEHQDSSGVQNSFLKAVWGDVEQPNIFVVGDDRQLIYGFGGASLSYFEEFKTAFGRAKCITLTENYRSTAPILSLADTLLSSGLANGKLTSNRNENHEITLFEYSYPRDEIIGAGLWFKEKIANSITPESCALLVPKNKHVRSAIETLRSLSLPVAGESSVSFFELTETATFRRILCIISDPYDSVSISQSFFDPISGISPMDAHRFLREVNTRKLSLDILVGRQPLARTVLASGENDISLWGETLSKLIDEKTSHSLVSFISHIGNTVFINTSLDHETLLRRTEIVRTMIHLTEMRSEKYPHETLSDFIAYLDRLESYGTHIPVATIGGERGIRVMTLHASKGLEFDAVWIAHMNEEVVMTGKRNGFTLPEKVAEKIEKKDMEVVRREVYVAITRARVYATLSYARADYRGSERSLLRVISEIPDAHFVRKNAEETTAEIMSHGVENYVKEGVKIKQDSQDTLISFVRDNYDKTKVSVTLLNNFFECPWKWYFRNFLQLPEIKSEILIFGSAVHKVLELVIKSESKPTKKTIESAIVRALESEGVADSRRLQTLAREGTDVVLRYIDESYDTLLEDRASERAISAHDKKYQHLMLYGKIDLTERVSPDEVLVTDFKTGSSKTSGMIEKEDDGRMSSYLRQLSMYSYLINLAEKGTEVSRSRLYFIEADTNDKNRIYDTAISNEHIELLKKDITDYDNFLKSGNWLNRPCNFKPYGTGNQECEHCALAKKIYH